MSKTFVKTLANKIAIKMNRLSSHATRYRTQKCVETLE